MKFHSVFEGLLKPITNGKKDLRPSEGILGEYLVCYIKSASLHIYRIWHHDGTNIIFSLYI